ncbi:hypothetical protein CEXT_753951 [Caerostris extrusa]|uniref:Uncharacterized protein n=1 Tax=Caerostris extrusa TaxID=172846 RepID=A0AAV4WYW6_CAEEX|nr:hypothetical protein CEXT_753951 [Caerostris extrusa]
MKIHKVQTKPSAYNELENRSPFRRKRVSGTEWHGSAAKLPFHFAHLSSFVCEMRLVRSQAPERGNIVCTSDFFFFFSFPGQGCRNASSVLGEFRPKIRHNNN